MCGIGGILFSNEKNENLHHKISIINETQRHRGPDGQFSLIFNQHALCHQRLALIDAEGGRQPFRDISGRYIIVYNGELYNYPELKHTLSDAYPFVTCSDTEVILAAFIVWGESCVQKFNGMFSFLIFDTLKETAFAARDPVGVKPFLYYHVNNTFIFASELKALLKVLNGHPEIDTYMLAEYVIAPYLSGGGHMSIFKDIRYLESGTLMHVDCRGIYLKKYYTFNWKPSLLSENKLVQLMSHEMENSVRMSLRADVPIGIFLSGGLDSSLIASIAVQHAKDPLKAFSIAFDNHSSIHFDSATIVNSNDLPFAYEIAECLALPFQEVKANYSSLELLFTQLAKINDRIPAWEQEFSQHFLAQVAARELKAVLVGDAADETNYGYFFLLNENINSSPLGLINLFGGQKRVKFLSPDLQQKKLFDYFDEHYRSLVKQNGFDFGKGGDERLLAMSTLVIKRWLERLLHNGDIHTMQFGLEARVPFANRNFLDIASQIYPHLGFKNGVEKYILRQAASKWLPPKFFNRKKSALPRDPRLGKAYQSLLLNLLKKKNDFIDLFLYRPALNALCELNTISEIDRMIMFNMICLIQWGNHYAK